MSRVKSLQLEFAGRPYIADLERGYDIAIAMRFNAPQLQAFGAPVASTTALQVGSFIGDVRRGGSCNCSSHVLTPHCNGTHTECVGHLTQEPMSVHDVIQDTLLPALLLTLTPQHMRVGNNDDVLITASQLIAALALHDNPPVQAVIIRTLPNATNKRTRNYDAGPMPAYFEPMALHSLAQHGVTHLLVDLPSVDRMDDGGHLLAHRAFWGLPERVTTVAQAQRPHATITELIYVPDAVTDGLYLLDLQIAAFEADAAPSRPVLYPLTSR